MTLSFSLLLPKRCWKYQKSTGFVEKMSRLFGHHNKLPEKNEHDYYGLAIDKLMDRNIPIYFICGKKLHTIREDKSKRWREGMDIHPVIFNRTKDRTQFLPTFNCKGTQGIKIVNENDYKTIFIIREDEFFETKYWELNPTEIETLAINDGFDNLSAFWSYFNTNFEGKLIHFTDLKY